MFFSHSRSPISAEDCFFLVIFFNIFGLWITESVDTDRMDKGVLLYLCSRSEKAFGGCFDQNLSHGILLLEWRFLPPREQNNTK